MEAVQWWYGLSLQSIIVIDTIDNFKSTCMYILYKTVSLNIICLNFDTLIIGHKLGSMLSILNKIIMQKGWKHSVTYNGFGTK